MREPRDLAVLVPSRGRPQNIARLIEAFDKTCRGDTQLIVGLDADDPRLDAYPLARSNYTVVVREGLRFVVAWINEMAIPRVDDFRFIGTIGDDNLPLTDGWDVRVCESLQRNVFCFGDDMYPGRPAGTLCCHVFMQSSVIKALGYMGPPVIQHMYVDPVWMAWGTATSIEFLGDVKIEHLHYSAQKSPQDPSYTASTALIPVDCRAYNDYCASPSGLNADIEKIRGRQFQPEGLAEFNHELNIPREWGQPA